MISESQWLVATGGLILTAFCAGVSLVWMVRGWLAKEFSGLKNHLFNKMESVEARILDKLEYHERHDDQRFGQITNDLWAVRVRLAANQGLDFNGKDDKEDANIKRRKTSS